MPDSKPDERDFCAAEYLEGVELPNGWKVLNRLSNSTGGNFGVSYEVERKHGGKTQRAFLKALNLRRIAKDPHARLGRAHLHASYAEAREDGTQQKGQSNKNEINTKS